MLLDIAIVRGGTVLARTLFVGWSPVANPPLQYNLWIAGIVLATAVASPVGCSAFMS